MTAYEKRFETRARQWAAFTRTWGDEMRLACATERADRLLWQMQYGIAQNLIVSGRPYQYCRMIYAAYAGKKA